MPHTSRKQRSSVPAQKRLQVTDDDGWTHVTSGGNVRRVMRTAAARTRNLESKPDPRDADRAAPESNAAGLVLGPAEAPSRLTLSELQAQYRTHRDRWMESETWAALKEHLGQRMRYLSDPAQQGEHEQSGPIYRGAVDAIVCIGLGSPSGFLRDGWVDRRSVSMYQLAALECIKDRLSCAFDCSQYSMHCTNMFQPKKQSKNKNKKSHLTKKNRYRYRLNPPLHPHLRPRPRLQHPRPHPPRITRNHSVKPPIRLRAHHPKHPPLLSRR